MDIVKIIDGIATRYSLRQLRLANPNVSFPVAPNTETLAEYDVYSYTETPKPVYDIATQNLSDDGIQQVDNGWVRVWSIAQKSAEEQAAYLQKVREGMVVTARQARLALASAGKLSSVADAIAAIAEPDKTLISIEWEYATTIERTSPWIEALRPALGLTEEELDALFVQAAEL